MENYEKIDEELYGALYGSPRKGNAEEIWNNIKENKELLNWAIKPRKDKFGERDIVNGLAICDTMLFDYEGIDKDIYQELVNLIYSNEQIARLVIDGDYSFLLMSLWNHNLKLTEEQKTFAVNEVMNSNTQAHGEGEFDIRYCILRNPNWTLEEKQKLIFDFYADDEDYDETLEQWECEIINDPANYKGNVMPLLDKTELYEYGYDCLSKFYKDKQVTDKIWSEIEFCKQMHQLRPQQWEVESAPKNKELVKNTNKEIKS